jgi:serine/threonine-protein kinase
VLAASKSSEPDNGYVQFVKGLAEYRIGRLQEAMPYLRDSAQKTPSRPAPRLVLAMAQFRSGAPTEARKTLAAAVAAYDWKQLPDDFPSACTNHILLGEAETMIVPNLGAFLEGKYQPQDNDERFALLAICQVQELYGTCAQLQADAFAADPTLADAATADCLRRAATEKDRSGRINVLNTEPRYLAARCAALAGCGLSHDHPKLNDSQRARWRKQSLEWLRADMAAWSKTLDGDSPGSREVAKTMLTFWLIEPDLVRLREPPALTELPAQEREEWASLWGQIRIALEKASHR